MARVEGRRKRTQHRTKTVMDFDPTPKALRDQKEVEAYMMKYDVQLPSNVKVEWCPSDTEYKKAPEAESVYLHPQVLALG